MWSGSLSFGAGVIARYKTLIRHSGIACKLGSSSARESSKTMCSAWTGQSVVPPADGLDGAPETYLGPFDRARTFVWDLTEASALRANLDGFSLRRMKTAQLEALHTIHKSLGGLGDLAEQSAATTVKKRYEEHVKACQYGRSRALAALACYERPRAGAFGFDQPVLDFAGHAP